MHVGVATIHCISNENMKVLMPGRVRVEYWTWAHSVRWVLNLFIKGILTMCCEKAQKRVNEIQNSSAVESAMFGNTDSSSATPTSGCFNFQSSASLFA